MRTGHTSPQKKGRTSQKTSRKAKNKKTEGKRLGKTKGIATEGKTKKSVQF